jgi:hypothetical protein
MVCTSLFIVSCNENGTGSSYGNKGITGVGGSIARMTITGDYLYAIAGHNVQLLDISVPASPAPWAQGQNDWDIEILFSYGDYLCVGAADGMHILDNTAPASPSYVGDF